jgi:hypothetical protein
MDHISCDRIPVTIFARLGVSSRTGAVTRAFPDQVAV